LKWGYSRGYHEFGHLPNPSNILLAIILAEAQVVAQAVPNVVAVQQHGQPALTRQSMLQGNGCRALPRPAQPSEPGKFALDESSRISAALKMLQLWTETCCSNDFVLSTTPPPKNSAAGTNVCSPGAGTVPLYAESCALPKLAHSGSLL